MNSILYRLFYWLGRAPWDSGITPPEVVQAFHDGNIPAGAAIDLGCGTGTNAIYMAKQGRQVVGIDFVPGAIAKARLKAQQVGVSDRVKFYTADVTRLSEMDLPTCGFALDMGCFHGLNLDGQSRYAEGLANILVSGGRYMLYTLDPRKRAGISFGVLPDQVKPVFTPWFDIVRMERGGFRDNGSTWFWMVRKGL